MSQQELDAVKQHQAMRDRLQRSITKSEAEQHRIMRELQDVVIVDKLVWPKSLKFLLESSLRSGDQHGIGVVSGEPSALTWYRVHRHALGQFADVAGLPRLFLSRLYDTDQSWRRGLLDTNFTSLFENTEYLGRNHRTKRFLVRIVGDQIRGFLSQNYNRKLTTARTLRSFIETCREHHAGPVEVNSTDVRFRVKYMLPLIFEPVEGEIVAFGASYGNSDFGAGRLSIGGVVMRMGQGIETLSVLGDKYSRTHLGPIIQDGDIEMSEETDDKEVAAAQSAIRDIVNNVLSPASIEKSLKAIELAHDKQIPWHQLKGKLKDLLSQNELSHLEYMLEGKAPGVDLPPIKDDTATAWWAANAVSSFAVKETDPDRRADLQTMAGQLISG